jgi:tetratricopeptide (TPR) repeat protein
MNQFIKIDLKLEKWNNVIEDCNVVLKKEKENVKALLRRSTAYFKKKSYKEAAKDIDACISIEPNNKKAIDLQKQIVKCLKEIETIKSNGGNRLTIEETDGEEQTDDEDKQKNDGKTMNSIKIIEVESETASESESESESEDETEAKSKLEAESELKAESKLETESELKAEPKLEAESELKAEPKLEAESELKAEPKLEAESKVEPKCSNEKERDELNSKPITDYNLPETIEIDKNKAMEYYKCGQYGESIKYYEIIIEELKCLINNETSNSNYSEVSLNFAKNLNSIFLKVMA